MGTPSAKKLLAWAKKGDVDALLALCSAAVSDEDEDAEVDTEGDETAYKWLLVAADFGHKKAASSADDMLEWSSMRYDDGALLQGLIAPRARASLSKRRGRPAEGREKSARPPRVREEAEGPRDDRRGEGLPQVSEEGRRREREDFFRNIFRRRRKSSRHELGPNGSRLRFTFA